MQSRVLHLKESLHNQKMKKRKNRVNKELDIEELHYTMV
jgi:hypothetical protein